MGNLTLSRGTMDFLISVLKKYRLIKNLYPPLPGQDEKSSEKTEYGIFKYNLFRYYLEIFVHYNTLFMSL